MYRNNSVRLSGGYRATIPQQDVVEEQPLSPTRRRSTQLSNRVDEQPLSPTRRRSPLLPSVIPAAVGSQVIDEEAYESPIPSVRRSSKSTHTDVFTSQADSGKRIITVKRDTSPPPVRRSSVGQSPRRLVGTPVVRKTYSTQGSRRSAELSTPPRQSHKLFESESASFEMSASDPNYQAIVELLRQCTTDDKCKMIKDHLSVGYDTDHTLNEAAANLSDLSIFNLLTERTGLNDVLATEKLTVFAPNNDAFRKLASSLGPARSDDQVATTLLSKLGTDNVRSTLLSHVVPDIWNADYLSKISNVDLITTSNQPLSVMPDNRGISVAIGDKSAEVVEADIPASNGVIHVIDHVI